MKQVVRFVVLAVVISHCGTSTHEKIEGKPNRVEVISNWGDGTVKEERIYLDDDVVEIMTYFENFKVNTKGRVKIVGEEEVRIGTWSSYYKNGTHWSQSEYSNGVSDGDYQTWYPNGKPNIIGFYSDGVETGKWQFFDTTGTVVKQYDVTPGSYP
jgi:antitoxin component YwqK of YwqJK toxin-antitoxin module